MISAVLNQVDDGLLDESDFTRAYIVSQMKKCYLRGGIDAGFFEPTPEIYFKKMIKPLEHCDNVFMTFFSFVLQRDFAVYCTTSTLVNGVTSTVIYPLCFYLFLLTIDY